MADSLSCSLQEKLKELLNLQNRTPDRPYSIIHRLQLGKAYASLGYPDLAAGDAYKALLLITEIVEEGEYYNQALEAAVIDFTKHLPHLPPDQVNPIPKLPSEKAHESEKETAVNWVKTSLLESTYDILVPSLVECQCFRSAFDFNGRALRAFPNASTFQFYQKTLESKLQSHFANESREFDKINIQEYPNKGLVRRELYPWNELEPDRFAPEVLQFLNKEMSQVAPKLEVKIVELAVLGQQSSLQRTVKQLGVFAKEDIAPGEQMLNEKSLLTGVARLHDSFCDACSIPLPSLSSEPNPDINITACEECGEAFFCGEECHNLAQDNYHPSLCGISFEQSVSAGEVVDSLYTLLLIRALALAETQAVHPLELKEVRYIWGDYHGLDLKEIWESGPDVFKRVPLTLPFSFESNILKPLHILEKMDVNIFEESYRYDTWVFNTLYAKFRGTASAQQGLDGRPEIGAVHPLWCLANHSCDPNVAWEWRGSMRFWARKDLVEFWGRHPSKKPGLAKGDEVMSHYCDVRLPVKERREWAVGALGGICVCPRCVWEENQCQLPYTAVVRACQS